MCSVAAQHFHRRTRRRPHRAVMAGTPVVEQAEEAAAYPVAPSCLSCGLWMKNNCNCVNALALMPWAGSDRALTSWLSRSRRPYPRHTLSVTFLRPPAPHPHPTEYAHNDALGVFRFFATLPSLSGTRTRYEMRQLLLWSLACSATAMTATRLAVSVTRASDARVQPLNSLWSTDERAVLVFLRHFG